MWSASRRLLVNHEHFSPLVVCAWEDNDGKSRMACVDSLRVQLTAKGQVEWSKKQRTEAGRAGDGGREQIAAGARRKPPAAALKGLLYVSQQKVQALSKKAHATQACLVRGRGIPWSTLFFGTPQVATRLARRVAVGRLLATVHYGAMLGEKLQNAGCRPVIPSSIGQHNTTKGAEVLLFGGTSIYIYRSHTRPRFYTIFMLSIGCVVVTQPLIVLEEQKAREGEDNDLMEQKEIDLKALLLVDEKLLPSLFWVPGRVLGN